jgi:membrane associated rhomboid family serine protease
MIIKNHVKIQAITNVTVGIINVILAFILAKEFGVLGACVSVFVAYTIRNVGYIIAYRKLLQFDIKKVIRECYLPLGIPMVITIALGFCLNYLLPDCNWTVFVMKTAIVGGLYLGLTFMLGLRKTERQRIVSVVASRLPFGK